MEPLRKSVPVTFTVPLFVNAPKNPPLSVHEPSSTVTLPFNVNPFIETEPCGIVNVELTTAFAGPPAPPLKDSDTAPAESPTICPLKLMDVEPKPTPTLQPARRSSTLVLVKVRLLLVNPSPPNAMMRS